MTNYAEAAIGFASGVLTTLAGFLMTRRSARKDTVQAMHSRIREARFKLVTSLFALASKPDDQALQNEARMHYRDLALQVEQYNAYSRPGQDRLSARPFNTRCLTPIIKGSLRGKLACKTIRLTADDFTAALAA